MQKQEPNPLLNSDFDTLLTTNLSLVNMNQRLKPFSANNVVFWDLIKGETNEI